MDDKEKNRLFDKMVVSKIITKDWLVKIPLSAIREYSEAIGADQEESTITTSLMPRGGDSYLFTYGEGSSDVIPPMLHEVYFCDYVNNKLEPISTNGMVMCSAISRDFYSRKSVIFNTVTINQDGRLYVTARHGDCLVANFYFDLTPGGGGCQFVQQDGPHEVWVWLDDDVVYISISADLSLPSP